MILGIKWFDLRKYEYAEQVMPEPVKQAFYSICGAIGRTPVLMSYEARKEILAALDVLWRTELPTADDVDKADKDAATLWFYPEESDARNLAEKAERDAEETRRRLRAWEERMEAIRKREEEEAKAKKTSRRKVTS